ncbi:hypothetical protein DFJ73DRAFT_824636, partial [Zopfochytrium polystomum]
MIFLCVTETIFFLIAQYRIITTMSQVKQVPVSIMHVVLSVLRSACYISAVLLHYLTSGEVQLRLNAVIKDLVRRPVFVPYAISVFIYQAPNIMILVLLSDITRIREIAEYYTLKGSSKDRESTGISTNIL